MRPRREAPTPTKPTLANVTCPRARSTSPGRSSSRRAIRHTKRASGRAPGSSREAAGDGEWTRAQRARQPSHVASQPTASNATSSAREHRTPPTRGQRQARTSRSAAQTARRASLNHTIHDVQHVRAMSHRNAATSMMPIHHLEPHRPACHAGDTIDSPCSSPEELRESASVTAETQATPLTRVTVLVRNFESTPLSLGPEIQLLQSHPISR